MAEFDRGNLLLHLFGAAVLAEDNILQRKQQTLRPSIKSKMAGRNLYKRHFTPFSISKPIFFPPRLRLAPGSPHTDVRQHPLSRARLAINMHSPSTASYKPPTRVEKA